MSTSARGKITKQEGLKSARDAALVTIGGLIPQLLDIAGAVDFGEYTILVSMVIAALAPLLNRISRN